VFFTQHALFPNAGPDWFRIGLAGAAFIALLRFHWSMPLVIALSGAAGFLWKVLR
jgi:chromate transport protein ChrA